MPNHVICVATDVDKKPMTRVDTNRIKSRLTKIVGNLPLLCAAFELCKGDDNTGGCEDCMDIANSVFCLSINGCSGLGFQSILFEKHLPRRKNTSSFEALDVLDEWESEVACFERPR